MQRRTTRKRTEPPRAQVLIVTFGSLAASTPYLAVIVLLVVLGWLRAAHLLDGLFKAEKAARARESEAAAKRADTGGGAAAAAAA